MAKTYHHGDLKSAAAKETIKIIRKKDEVNFTLREIAQSLKVSHTAVYRHFKSKQDLLSYIAKEGFQNLLSSFEQTLTTVRTPRQKLHAIGQAYIEFAIDNPAHYRSMFHWELRCSETHDQELNENGEKSFQVLMGILQEGIKGQVFRKVDPLLTARSIWSSIHGFSILYLDGQLQDVRTKTDIKAAIECHLEFIERSILK